MLLLFIKFFANKNTTKIEQTEENLEVRMEFRASQQNKTEISETEHKYIDNVSIPILFWDKRNRIKEIRTEIE